MPMEGQTGKIVNARLMAEITQEFKIGADILGKGNRKLEKEYGAENRSGDTVFVPITDTGKVYRKLDIENEWQNGELDVARDAVPVTVTPLLMAASVTQADLTLSIKNPEIFAKRTATLANSANLIAIDTLMGNSQVVVASDTTDNEINDAAFEAEGFTTASKFGGETFGVAHPLTWNKITRAQHANFGDNQSLGGKLYENELGNFMGFKWSKGARASKVSGLAMDTLLGNVTVTWGSDVVTIGGAFATTYDANSEQWKGKTFPVPFKLANVQQVDALGTTIMEDKTLWLQSKVTAATLGSENPTYEWRLGAPLFKNITDPRKNCEYTGTSEALSVALAADNVLDPEQTYLAPATIWKQNDFLVAVKGLEKFYGSDSFTAPTNFGDRGILPLRGTCWTNPGRAKSLFRIDCLMGCAAYTGLSMASVFIPARS